ncbi:hypothetical protein ABCS02_28575 [Microbacterium sp. X-17]|uniref:hypothetical protein n=1 Tax=Microbacterium sp. X-17 TaxID=3144404 RepID=UPI0031F57703
MSAIIAELQVVRIAGLASDHLELVRTLDGWLLQELESSREDLATWRRAASDELYSLIPTLQRADRRTALALRRRMHSDDLGPIAGDASSILSAGLADRLAAAERLHEDLRLKVESAVRSDEARVPSLIRRALETSEIRDALDLLAPGFRELSQRSAFTVGARHTRTALAYMGRAALKPSPLSTLTSVGTPGSTDARKRIDPSPLFLFRLLHTLVDDPSLVTTLEFKPAYVIDRKVVVRRVIEAHGSAWLEEDIVSLDPYANEYERLRDWRGGDFDSLAALAGADPHLRIARWVKLGLVQVVVPGRPGDHPQSALARSLRRIDGNPHAAELARNLELLETALRSAESARKARQPALASAQAVLEQIGQDFRVRKQTARLLNEDSVSPAPVGSSNIDAMLRRWGDGVRPSIFRSHRYDAIVRRFEQEVGPDSTHPDAAAFFIAAYASREFRDSMRDAWSEDRAWIERPSTGRSFLPAGDTNAPPTVGVMYQELADPRGGGGPAFVVNQLVNGVGGIVARFGAVGGGTGSRIRADLLAWIDGMFPGVAATFAFHPSSEVNPLQGAARGLLPSIEWPTDPRRTGQELTFEHVGLKHDSKRGVLDFVDQDGRPVAIAHLGIVPAWSIAGARGLALCVMDPWVDGTALTLESNPVERARVAHAEPRYRPREQVEDVVVRRETWMVESSELPIPGKTETTAEFLCRFDRWRRAHGIPEEAFGLAISSRGFASEARKPLWVNMLSTHSLYATLPLLREGTHVRFQEVLPGRRAGGHRVTEHVRFLRWKRSHDD